LFSCGAYFPRRFVTLFSHHCTNEHLPIGGCGKYYYCSDSCQATHWLTHVKECQAGVNSPQNTNTSGMDRTESSFSIARRESTLSQAESEAAPALGEDPAELSAAENAILSTVNTDDLDEQQLVHITCAIHKGSFLSLPVLGACGHSFCSSCVKEQLESNQAIMIVCPVDGDTLSTEMFYPPLDMMDTSSGLTYEAERELKHLVTALERQVESPKMGRSSSSLDDHHSVVVSSPSPLKGRERKLRDMEMMLVAKAEELKSRENRIRLLELESARTTMGSKTLPAVILQNNALLLSRRRERLRELLSSARVAKLEVLAVVRELEHHMRSLQAANEDYLRQSTILQSVDEEMVKMKLIETRVLLENDISAAEQRLGAVTMETDSLKASIDKMEESRRYLRETLQKEERETEERKERLQTMLSKMDVFVEMRRLACDADVEALNEKVEELRKTSDLLEESTEQGRLSYERNMIGWEDRLSAVREEYGNKLLESARLSRSVEEKQDEFDRMEGLLAAQREVARHKQEDIRREQQKVDASARRVALLEESEELKKEDLLRLEEECERKRAEIEELRMEAVAAADEVSQIKQDNRDAKASTVALQHARETAETGYMQERQQAAEQLSEIKAAIVEDELRLQQLATEMSAKQEQYHQMRRAVKQEEKELEKLREQITAAECHIEQLTGEVKRQRREIIRASAAAREKRKQPSQGLFPLEMPLTPESGTAANPVTSSSSSSFSAPVVVSAAVNTPNVASLSSQSVSATQTVFAWIDEEHRMNEDFAASLVDGLLEQCCKMAESNRSAVTDRKFKQIMDQRAREQARYAQDMEVWDKYNSSQSSSALYPLPLLPVLSSSSAKLRFQQSPVVGLSENEGLELGEEEEAFSDWRQPGSVTPSDENDEDPNASTNTILRSILHAQGETAYHTSDQNETPRAVRREQREPRVPFCIEGPIGNVIDAPAPEDSFVQQCLSPGAPLHLGAVDADVTLSRSLEDLTV
jgi:hypothetical protein